MRQRRFFFRPEDVLLLAVLVHGVAEAAAVDEVPLEVDAVAKKLLRQKVLADLCLHQKYLET